MKDHKIKRILQHFQEGAELTVVEAIRLFHTTELRRVVTELRRRGHDIQSRWCEDVCGDGSVSRFKVYFLSK